MSNPPVLNSYPVVLFCIFHQPMTAAEISTVTDLKEGTVRHALTALHDAGLTGRHRRPTPSRGKGPYVYHTTPVGSADCVAGDLTEVAGAPDGEVPWVCRDCMCMMFGGGDETPVCDTCGGVRLESIDGVVR